MFLSFNKVSNLKTVRAGVIPYSIINNSLYFLLGVDTKTGELTDFGGGVKYNESSIDGAMREFEEETYRCLARKHYDVRSDELQQSKILSDKEKMTIIFMKIDPEWFNKASDNFFHNKQYSNLRYHEISKIIWVHENKFRKLINGYNDKNIMWSKIQNFLCKNNNDAFYENLKNPIKI